MSGTVNRERGEKRTTTHAHPRLEGLESRLVLSTFKVNTLLDTVAVNLKTGKDASGHISLRSAIEAANSRPNSDTILLPNGTIKLTIAGANEDNAATGDLDIKGNVTIKGKRASSTIVDGNSLDRVFQVLFGRVQISGLTIQHGQATEGGGLLNSGGQVTLNSVVVANNMAVGSSGALGSDGTDGTGQAGDGGGGGAGEDGLGGGIFNQAGSLSLSESTIEANQGRAAMAAWAATPGRARASAAARSVTSAPVAWEAPVAAAAPRAAVGCTMRPAPASPFPPQRSWPTRPLVAKAARAATAAEVSPVTVSTAMASPVVSAVTAWAAQGAKAVRPDRAKVAACSTWAPFL